MENNDYKEKYESLIDAIKVLRDTNPSDEGIQNWIKDFVPELAESEDERIRKALIGYFSMGANNNETTFNIEDKKILAWLEKQDNRDARYKYLEKLLEADTIYQMAVNDAMVEEAKTKAIEAISNMDIWDLLEPKKQGDHKLAWSEELKESEDERIRKALISILKSDFEKDTTIFDISIEQTLAWLEKQGTTQKPFTFNSLPRLLGMIEPSDRAIAYSNKLADSLENEGYTTDSKIVRESIKMMRGEKVPLATMDETEEGSTGNPNKEVSPKFGVFSWICDGRSTRQITQVLDCGFYVFDDGFNSRCEDIDSKYHLWTIQDAKNGDILVIYPEVGSELPEQIFIFKEIKDRSYVKDAVEFHCKYANNEFSINKQSFMGQSTINRYLPATRAQRNLLISKMKKSGYEWNFNTKEVEEIGESLINFYKELGQP